MHGGPQIRQGDSIQLLQRDLNGGAGRQGLQILKNALNQIVVFSAPIPAQIRQHNPVIIQYWFLILRIIFSHTCLVTPEDR